MQTGEHKNLRRWFGREVDVISEASERFRKKHGVEPIRAGDSLCYWKERVYTREKMRRGSHAISERGHDHATSGTRNHSFSHTDPSLVPFVAACCS